MFRPIVGLVHEATSDLASWFVRQRRRQLRKVLLIMLSTRTFRIFEICHLRWRGGEEATTLHLLAIRFPTNLRPGAFRDAPSSPTGKLFRKKISASVKCFFYTTCKLIFSTMSSFLGTRNRRTSTKCAASCFGFSSIGGVQSKKTGFVNAGKTTKNATNQCFLILDDKNNVEAIREEFWGIMVG